MRIAEPMTMLTDYALAGLTAGFSIRLFAVSRDRRQVSVAMWAFAFLTTACAAALGGTSHGFKPYLSQTVNNAVWKTTLYAIVLSSYLMLTGMIIASVGSPVRRLLLAVASVTTLVLLAPIGTRAEFRY